MKFLFIMFFVFGFSFVSAQQNSYTDRGQSSYTPEDFERVRKSIRVQSPAVSHEQLNGTWAYSGSGCRAPSLDPSTHQSQASDLSVLISSMILNFYNFGEVKVRGLFLDEEALLRGNREKLINFEEEGSYTIAGNRIDFDNSQEGFFDSFKKNYFVEDHLVLTDLSLDGIQACGLDHISVFIFRKVD